MYLFIYAFYIHVNQITRLASAYVWHSRAKKATLLRPINVAVS